MITDHLQDLAKRRFEEELSNDRNIYLKHYYSSKEMEDAEIKKFLKKELDDSEITLDDRSDSSTVFNLDDNDLIVHITDHNSWLLVYTSKIPQRVRDKLTSFSRRNEWLLDGWIPGEVVDELYQKHAPDEDRVTVKKSWDPYWIYQRDSRIRPDLQEVVENNLKEFVERDIEFRISTPKWMVDEVLNEELSDELREKSETEQSRFKYVLSNPGTANVTVDKDWQITHHRGQPEATFKMVEEINESSNGLREKVDKILPSREYEQYESGIMEIVSYKPPGTLKLTFIESDYTPENSIKLSNLLTVGQNDAKIHGVISHWDGCEFLTFSSLAFDNSEYRIHYSRDDDGTPALYIHPISGTVEGMLYIYRKLRQKFDPRIQHEAILPQEKELAD